MKLSIGSVNSLIMTIKNKFLQQVIEISEKAGEKILSYYEQVDPEVTRKDDESPLTQADLAAHDWILEQLKSIDPETPVISEESELPDYETRKHWSKFWLVDPLDGTKEFLKKNGEFTVNIALIDQGVPVLGVIHAPALSITYFADQENGSFKKENQKEPERIFANQKSSHDSLLVISSRSHASTDLEEKLKDYTVEDRVSIGSSLKFCLLAEGKADLYPRLGPTMEWDVAAGDCIYRNAAKSGENPSPFQYNKKDLKNEGFFVGTPLKEEYQAHE